MNKIETDFLQDMWEVATIFDVVKGKLKVVETAEDDGIFLAGDSFISAYSADLSPKWECDTNYPITAMTQKNGTIYIASKNKVEVLDNKGNKIASWGTFDSNSILTSISANDNYVAIADAGVKVVYIFDNNGNMLHVMGKSDERFIVPSPYFDLHLANDNTLFVANPGRLRIEHRNIDGTLIDFFGEPGMDPSSFCICCNPTHFCVNNKRFITAEKGLNRIKILSEKGEFIEFVNSNNSFLPPIPLDIAVSSDGSKIYGAYSGNSKLYIFKRKPNAQS